MELNFWKMVRRGILKFLLIVAACIAWFGSNAQCAMCRAVAEESMYDDSYGFAMGLNSGIIMLMLIPYLLLISLFAIFFRKQIGSFFKSFNSIH